MNFSASAKLREIEREIKMRRDVYKRRVASGQMAPHVAAHQIEIMEAIAEDYRQQAASERLL